jgi:hypothetical protein
MHIFAYLYDFMHIVLDEAGRLDGGPAGRICEPYPRRRGEISAISWNTSRKVPILTIGSPCRLSVQGCERFAFGNRQEFSAAFT